MSAPSREQQLVDELRAVEARVLELADGPVGSDDLDQIATTVKRRTVLRAQLRDVYGRLAFERTRLPGPDRDKVLELFKGDEEAADRQLARYARVEHYRDATYHAVVDRNAPHGLAGIRVWHLSIKRLDREPIHDWRILQAIKTAVLGPDVEAVELYPSEARLVDTANQYHLWAIVADDTGAPLAWPFGFSEGLRADHPNFGGAKQRPGSGA